MKPPHAPPFAIALLVGTVSAAWGASAAPLPTATGLTTSSNPAVFGADVTFTATVSGGSNPTGTVIFFDGGAVAGTDTLTARVATVTTHALTVGTHFIRAQYFGDPNSLGSVSATLSQVVRANTSTTVTVSAPASTFGEPVTFTVIVTPTAPGVVPTGSVALTEGGGTLASAALQAGKADIVLPSLSVAAHSIRASYPGDASTNASISTPVSHTVHRAESDIAVSASANPSVWGQAVTFTVSFTAVAPSLKTPLAGGVTLDVGGQSFPLTLSNGKAVLPFNALSPMVRDVAVSFPGDASFLASNARISHTVDRARTRLTLSASANPSSYGRNVTFTAAFQPVAPSPLVPTEGLLTLQVGGGESVALALAGQSTAAINGSGLEVGATVVSAVWPGDSNFSATSVTLTQTVNKAAASARVVSPVNPSVYGQPVTFQVQVSPSVTPDFALQPTGTVTLTADEGGLVLAADLALDAHQSSSFTAWAALPAGNHLVSATYSGDSRYGPGSNQGVVQDVQKAPTATTITIAPNPAHAEQAFTLTVAVAPVSPGAGAPSGDVRFGSLLGYPLTGGRFTLAVTAPRAGQDLDIVAEYQGDENFVASEKTLAFTILPRGDQPVASFEITPDQPSAHQTVRFTDTSSGFPAEWAWDFGDGSASSEQNPLHAYAAAGTYDVRLRINADPEVTRTLTISEATTRTTRLVPIVLDVVSGSARFTTELVLVNRGSAPTPVSLRYTPSLGSLEGGGTVTTSLGAGEQRVIDDAIAFLRAQGLAIPASGPQGGTLLVSFETVSAEEVAAVTARTASATAAPQPAGRAGLAYAGLTEAEGSTGRLYVFGLRSNARDRSNLAVFNASSEPVIVRVTLRSGDGDGKSAVLDNLSLPPYGWFQYSGLLVPAGMTNAWAFIDRVAGTGKFGAYGVVNDNATNDGSFLAAVPASIGASHLFVPVLVETASFKSELVVANRGSARAAVTLHYQESLNGAAGPGGNVTLLLEPGDQRIIPEVHQFLRSYGADIGPSPGSFVGRLRGDVMGVPAGDVFLAARTAAPSPSGGQFGLFTPALYSEEGAAEVAYLYGLRADAANRSNVAVVNMGVADPAGANLGPSHSIGLVLQAFDGNAGGVPRGAPTSVTLAPGEWKQLDGFLAGKGVTNGWVRIVRSTSAGNRDMPLGRAPWLAYAVINDGGSPGQRTGDGAYVAMTK